MVSLSTAAKEQIQTLLSEAVKDNRVPGVVFGATSVKEELYFAHAGLRVFEDPSGGPLTDDSIFWICSQTKLIVAIAVLQLVEQGVIQLDTPAYHILPELANPVVLKANSDTTKPDFRPAERDITIRHLLNHSSGLFYPPAAERIIPGALPAPYTAKYNKDDAISQFYNKVKGQHHSLSLKFEPGTSWEYGYSSDCLGFIVERISGENLEEYFKKHIFGPLGMTSTSFYLTPDLKSRTAGVSFRGADGKIVPWADQYPIIEQEPNKVHIHLGGVGLYASLKDYLILLRHLLQIKAETAISPILKPDSVHLLFQPSLTTVGEKAVNDRLQATDYQFSSGMCINMTDRPGKRKKGSGWWYGWANTYYFVDPGTGVALVLGSQLLPTRDAEILKLWEEIEEVFYGDLKV